MIHRLKVALNPERWLRVDRPNADLVTWAGFARETMQRWTDRRHWSARRKVLRGLQLPHAPNTRGLWAVTMVKNEADIIEHTLRHLVTQGVDRILVVDNGSSDGTLQLLRHLQQELPLLVGLDNEAGYYQAHKMTELARFARKHGAKWVIPFDADEFWFATGTSLGDYLASTRATQIRAQIYNIFPTLEQPILTGLTGRLEIDCDTAHPPKIAVRARPLLWIDFGNHWALTPGWRHSGLRILHVPWRSYSQFSSKLKAGAKALAAADIDAYVGAHWRAQQSNDDLQLRLLWESLLMREAPQSLGWYPKGPFIAAEPRAWSNWDPDGVLSI